MSAYASLTSLPGSFLPPFFAFGTPPSSSSSSASSTASNERPDAEPRPDEHDAPRAKRDDARPAGGRGRPPPDAAADDEDDASWSPDSTPFQSFPRQGELVGTAVAIRSARVDPVELIKSLTSRGSSIARRTASFIARAPPPEEEKGDGGGSVFSGPGACYEDSDSDDEFSMYDYSDDFSTPGGAEEPGCDDAPEEDPSAIEFDLSISFQGRRYNATRAFPTFVKLRRELLDELSENDRRSKRSGAAGCHAKTGGGPCSMGIPELPRVSPENLGHGGFAFGVARTGFALLQATAQHYCPEMEGWMMQVIESFPCSQSLSSFLWEPLSASGEESWDTIGEDCCSGVVREKVSLGDATGKPTVRSKPKGKTLSRFKKSMGSMTSLNSIGEGDENDCEDDDW